MVRGALAGYAGTRFRQGLVAKAGRCIGLLQDHVNYERSKNAFSAAMVQLRVALISRFKST